MFIMFNETLDITISKRCPQLIIMFGELDVKNKEVCVFYRNHFHDRIYNFFFLIRMYNKRKEKHRID